MNIWDISRTLSNELSPWPGDTPFAFHLAAEMSRGSSVNVGAISMSVHNGTHADAPFHFDQSGAAIDTAVLEKYLGLAAVIDLSGRFSEANPFITIDQLQPNEELISGAPRLLIRTGAWQNSTVFPSWIPVLAPGAAEWLEAHAVFLLGLDVPSVDPIDAKVLANHHALARAGISIVESLDLKGIEAGRYQFAALPLKISGGDGAPVRAVLWRDE